jgi:predicted molibdopterin-dependent oxidoreductase YjgC
MENLRIGSIKRKKQVTIHVNGKKIIAYKGETVLAALIAAGYKSLKKSKTIGETRGPLCGMGVCYECQVSIDGVQNRRSCMIEVEDDMEIGIDES